MYKLCYTAEKVHLRINRTYKTDIQKENRLIRFENYAEVFQKITARKENIYFRNASLNHGNVLVSETSKDK